MEREKERIPARTAAAPPSPAGPRSPSARHAGMYQTRAGGRWATSRSAPLVSPDPPPPSGTDSSVPPTASHRRSHTQEGPRRSRPPAAPMARPAAAGPLAWRRAEPPPVPPPQRSYWSKLRPGGWLLADAPVARPGRRRAPSLRSRRCRSIHSPPGRVRCRRDGAAAMHQAAASCRRRPPAAGP